ncbi:energy transducer TonB, partial [Bacteroidota bacterium]
VYFIVDEMPVFKENIKNYMDFRQWIGANLKYPEEAIGKQLEGKVFVQFVVSEQGVVKNVRIVRGVDPVLDEYTLELIKNSPKWLKPGYQDDKAVNVAFTFPIDYVLQKEEKE